MSEKEKQIARDSGADHVVVTPNYVIMVVGGQVISQPRH